MQQQQAITIPNVGFSNKVKDLIKQYSKVSITDADFCAQLIYAQLVRDGIIPHDADWAMVTTDINLKTYLDKEIAMSLPHELNEADHGMGYVSECNLYFNCKFLDDLVNTLKHHGFQNVKDEIIQKLKAEKETQEHMFHSWNLEGNPAQLREKKAENDSFKTKDDIEKELNDQINSLILSRNPSSENLNLIDNEDIAQKLSNNNIAQTPGERIKAGDIKTSKMDDEATAIAIAQQRRFLLRSRLPDEEWDALFQLQKKYRKAFKITTKQLLNEINLPINLQQYLYSQRSRPSNRPGSNGASLREKLKQLLSQWTENAETVIAAPYPEQIDSFYLEEILEDQKEFLQKIGVLTMYFEGETIVVATAEESFNQKLFDEYIASTALSARPRRFTTNSYCLVGGSGVIGVTARHNLVVQQNALAVQQDAEMIAVNAEMIVVKALLAYRSDGRYSIVADRCHIGSSICDSDIHPDYDLAIFHPLSTHSYLVNMFNMNSSFRMDKREIINFDYNNNSEVFKFGVATGITCGKIESSSVSPPYFWVTSTEVGDFGMRGDSGSLIICSETNLAIGVLSRFEKQNRRIVCVMLRYLFDIAVLNDDME
eukprot:gene15529-20964_t